MTLADIQEIAIYGLACLGFSTGIGFWIFFFKVIMSDRD